MGESDVCTVQIICTSNVDNELWVKVGYNFFGVGRRIVQNMVTTVYI